MMLYIPLTSVLMQTTHHREFRKRGLR